MFYASASSNVWRYFSGRSYVCCHHLDPGVFSSLPPKVAIQQWKYYMQTFLKWCQEIFMFFRNFVLYQRIFCFFQWTFYLLLSCATFSSVDNVTECVDCVSGWTFFCPQNVSSVYKCLICVLIGLFLNVSNYVQKLVPSAKHRRPSKSRLWPIDQEICIWYQHSAIHLTAVNMKC